MWWRSALQSEIAEERVWSATPLPPVHVFGDASGSPPQLGVVVCADAVWYWTYLAPGDSVMQPFARRRDCQIMGLELLAISLAMCTFERILRGRTVVVHCDNSGAEVRSFGSCVLLACPRPVLVSAISATWDSASMGPRAVGS